MENIKIVSEEEIIKMMIEEGCYRYKSETSGFQVISKNTSPYSYPSYVQSHGFIVGYKKNGDPKYFNLHTLDMNRKDFPVITQMIYEPNLPFGKVENEPLFNTAKPLDVKFPIEGKNNGRNVSIFWNHLEYLCGDVSQEIKEWVKDWLCDIFQNPNEKKGTALVFIGGQGCGKSIFFNVLMRKLLNGYHHLDDGKGFSERFNQELKGKLLINFNEGFATKSKLAEAKLKSFITESTFRIEGKGANSVTVLNPARAVFTTNSQFAINTVGDDRRFAVFRTLKRDFITPDYFDKFSMAIDNTEMLQKFMYELKTRDIESRLNIPPMTDAKEVQKVYSADKVQDWFEFIITTPRDYEVELTGSRSPIAGNYRNLLWNRYNDTERWMYKEHALESFLKFRGSSNINSTNKLFHALDALLRNQNEWSISNEAQRLKPGEGLGFGASKDIDKVQRIWVLRKNVNP